MSGFFDSCFLFLDNPRGGVEDIAYLKNKCPWIKGVFCNVRNYPVEQWEQVVLPRCIANDLFCGPWGRTAEIDSQGNQIEPAVFDPSVVDKIIDVEKRWSTPGIINSEKEINGKQHHLNYITKAIEGSPYDTAISMEPTPFANLDWRDVGIALPQIMPLDQGGKIYEPEATKQMWWDAGVRCVYITFGVYGGIKPTAYPLKAPYSLFTGDVIMASYSVERWIPTESGWIGCKTPQEEVMEKIGDQDGIRSAMNRLRALDPNGTIVPKDQTIDDLESAGTPLSSWKAWDKLERTLQILKDDHDGSI